jgi:hypothetical protein
VGSSLWNLLGSIYGFSIRHIQAHALAETLFWHEFQSALFRIVVLVPPSELNTPVHSSPPSPRFNLFDARRARATDSTRRPHSEQCRLKFMPKHVNGRVELRRRYEYYKYVSTACPVTYANDIFHIWQSQCQTPTPDILQSHTPDTYAMQLRHTCSTRTAF